MTNSFISQVRANVFARRSPDVSNTELERSAAQMRFLAQDELRYIAGGDGESVDGSPKGSWKASSGSTTV